MIGRRSFVKLLAGLPLVGLLPWGPKRRPLRYPGFVSEARMICPRCRRSWRAYDCALLDEDGVIECDM